MERDRTVRFGVFEADLGQRELRKHGVRLRLQEQPFKILAALLEKPGEVVSREVLIRLLWPDGTFVDFDKGLNAALNRLRQILADSAESPRYIETVARRGYRFIAPVEAAKEASTPAPEPAVVVEAPRRRAMPVWVMVIGAVALVAAGAWLVQWPQESASPNLVPVPLTSYDGVEQHPTFSPDGTQVAFSWNGPSQDSYDIYVKAVGAGSSQRLTSDPAFESCPAWSPDGRNLAFFREGQGVHLISPTGGPERKLLSADVMNELKSGCQMSWSPDGKHLAFARPATSNEPPGIFVIPVDGGEASRVSGITPPGVQLMPAFSPDGRSLAIVTGTYPQNLTILPLDENLVPGLPGHIVARRTGNTIVSTAWTRDGKSIVFGEVTYGTSLRLWKVSVRDGAEPQTLAFAGPGSVHPAIAPSGLRMAFTQTSFDYDIWNFGSSTLTRSPLSSTRVDRNPQFSPDGGKVAFASDRSGRAEIWVANSDGSNAVQLTFSRASGTPRWSPDGRRIVYDTQDEHGLWDVNVVDSSGGTPVPIVRHPANDSAPSFSRDGKWIYFSSDRSGTSEIYRVPSSGGEPDKLTEKGGWVAFESADGKSIYYSKQSFRCGGPLFRRALEGGPEHQVVDSACARGFAVIERGIYYLVDSGKLSEATSWPVPSAMKRTISVRLFDPADGSTREVRTAKADRPLDQPFHLAVARDGSTMLLGAATQGGADLFLVENFR